MTPTHPTVFRRCSICLLSKPLEAFEKSPTKPLGRGCRCKECNALRARQRKAKNPQSYAAAQQKYQARRAPRNAYDPSAARRARDSVRGAVYRGTLSKPELCEACGRKVAARLLHAHHVNYEERLNVKWVCSACHGKEHRKYA